MLLTTGVYTGKLCINKEAGLTHTWWWLFKEVARFLITEATEEGYKRKSLQIFRKLSKVNFVLFIYFLDKIYPDVSPLWSTSKGGQVDFPPLHKKEGNYWVTVTK